MAGHTLSLRYGPLYSPITERDLPGTWPNWHLTSSGVGHHYIPPGVFPPITAQSSVAASLPLAGKQDPYILAFDEVLSRWDTTSSSAYQLKAHIGPHEQPRATEPAYPLRTLGMKDLGEKLRRRGWCRPLTTRYHSSETKAQHLGWPSLDEYDPIFVRSPGQELQEQQRQELCEVAWRVAPRLGTRPGAAGTPALGAWATVGSGKLNIGYATSFLFYLSSPNLHQPTLPWTKKVELSGPPLIVLEPGVLDCRQMYLTTSAKDFRSYSKKELLKYSLKGSQISSKTLGWGNGQECLPQPPRAHVDCAIPVASSVSYQKLRSLTQESYKPPLHPFVTLDRFCPVETPWVLHRNPLPSIYSVPKIYCTESSRYGSMRAELV
ncbi:stabilizer of axonemal microtubules 3 [Thomomys bottae]